MSTVTTAQYIGEGLDKLNGLLRLDARCAALFFYLVVYGFFLPGKNF